MYDTFGEYKLLYDVKDCLSVIFEVNFEVLKFYELVDIITLHLFYQSVLSALVY